MASLEQLAVLVDDLWKEEAIRLSDFFGIDEDALKGEADLSLTRIYFSYSEMPGEKPVISVPLGVLFKKIDSEILSSVRHEVRHGIERNVRRYVMREHPIEFMGYFDDLFAGENFSLLSEFSCWGQVKKIYQKIDGIDRTSPKDITDNMDVILAVYHRLTYNKPLYYMNETFSGNGKLSEKRIRKLGVAQCLTALAVLANGAALIYTAKSGIAAPLTHTVLFVLNMYDFVFSTLEKEHYTALPQGIGLTEQTLAKYPTSARKYLLGMPLVCTIEEHLGRISGYGLDISK